MAKVRANSSSGGGSIPFSNPDVGAEFATRNSASDLQVSTTQKAKYILLLLATSSTYTGIGYLIDVDNESIYRVGWAGTSTQINDKTTSFSTIISSIDATQFTIKCANITTGYARYAVCAWY